MPWHRNTEGDRRVVSRWSGACVKPDQFRVSVGPYAQRSINGCGAHSAPRQISRSTVVTGLAGSLALLPLAWAQGSATRRRVPRLPAANPPYDGTVPGAGDPIRVIGIWRILGFRCRSFPWRRNGNRRDGPRPRPPHRTGGGVACVRPVRGDRQGRLATTGAEHRAGTGRSHDRCVWRERCHQLPVSVRLRR